VPDRADNAEALIGLIAAKDAGRAVNTAELLQRLQTTMQREAGALRNDASLRHALSDIEDIGGALGADPAGTAQPFDMQRLDWFDLRNMLLVARVVAAAALRRTESRGAQRREDYAATDPAWAVNQVVTLDGEDLAIANAPAAREAAVA